MHFSFETQNSQFLLKQEIVDQIEVIFKKYKSTRPSNWTVGAMSIVSPSFIRPAYRIVFSDAIALFSNLDNYNLIPENER